MKKYICAAGVCFIFIAFACFIHTSETAYDVLKVISPFEIALDFNRNDTIEDNEIVKILDGYQYISKDDLKNGRCTNIAVLSVYPEYVIRSMIYLSQKYANDMLLDKKVRVKNTSKEIFIGSDNYNELLLKSGYIFKDGKPVSSEKFLKNIDYINKAEFKIYNLKSEKYHNMTCKYGLMAHNCIILPKSKLPKGAKPCKYCLPRDEHKKSSSGINKNRAYLTKPLLSYTNGAIKIFLTDYTTKLKPDRYGNTELCRELVKQINSAQKSIDIAIYGYDRVPKIENALRKAIKRGVQVRLIYDTDSKNTNIYADTDEFAALIPNSRCDRAPFHHPNPVQYTNSIMHNKFYIFDKALVITGSANLSHTDMSGFNVNSAILIRSAQIAEIYTKEFEQMYNNRFHDLKHKIPNKENIVLGDVKLSIYFSPADSVIERVIVPLINKAESYIYMPVFLITDKRLSEALIRAKHRGVDIKIITDAANAKNKYSKHGILRTGGVSVKTENYAGKLHSKSIIIDDKYTVIGSMNFSLSGAARNDENIVVLENPEVAKFYCRFFKYLWSRIPDTWLYKDVNAESVHSIGSCSDGLDNDYDGLVDLEDEGCRIH